MTLQELKDATTSLVAQSDLKGAIDLLFRFIRPQRQASAVIVQLSARFHRALNDDHKGATTREQVSIEYNRIAEALIHLTESLREADIAVGEGSIPGPESLARAQAISQEHPVDIFIAYSRRDTQYLDELRTHLAPLERSKRVRIWYDGKIEPGAVWEDAIKIHLHGAGIILLLVSADAIASDYFYDREMSDALERHHQGTARVVPLIVRPCAWKTTPLGELQALPKDGKPVTDWPVRDSAYADAVEALLRMVNHIESAQQEQFAEVERQRLEAEAAEREAESRRAEEARLRQEAEAERQRQEQEERLAVAARKATYLQVLERARACQQNAQWADARSAWQQALGLYETAFPESASALQGHIAACEKALQLQAEYERRMQETAQMLRRRDWARAKAAAQAALQARPGDAEAQRLLAEAEAGSQLPAPPQPPYLRWAGIAGGVLLLVFLVLKWTGREEKPGRQDDPWQAYAEKWRVAEEQNTIPLWRNLANILPEGDRREEARRRLNELEASYKGHIENAKMLERDGITDVACNELREALRLNPEEREAIERFRRLGCKR